MYDGTQDLGLWRPPNPDRDLWDAYGDDLRAMLEKERKRLGKGRLAIGDQLRLHPGKLHCDFLIWVASRPPHGETEAAPAPSIEVVQDIARRVIEFVAQQDVVRVAFPALGAGRGEASIPDRMAAIVRAVAAYKEACFAAERPTHIEEVIVCDASSANVAKAKRQVERLARTGYVEPTPAPVASRPAERTTSSGSKRAASKPGEAKGRKGARLRPEDIAAARARSAPYDRGREYIEGEFFIHPVFGVGQVQTVKPERMVVVLFENGEERTMIHGR